MTSPPVDTTYYDLLQVPTTATDTDLKKAYRRAAIQHHPDKNPHDPQGAAVRFQEVSQAYQVLSDPNLRRIYDECGLDAAQEQDTLEDPTVLFARIFGGDSFQAWVGELSYIADMIRYMEILKPRDNLKKTSSASATSPPATPPQTASKYLITDSSTTTSPPLPPRPASNAPPIIPHSNHSSPAATAAAEAAAKAEAEAKAKQHQQEQLAAFHLQRETRRGAQIASATQSIANRIQTLLTLSRPHHLPRSADPTAFKPDNPIYQALVRERELLKLESFGVRLLHEIGGALVTHANATLNPWPVMKGLRGFFVGKMEEFSDSYGAVRSALAVERELRMMRIEAEEAGDSDDTSSTAKEERERVEVGLMLETCWCTTRKEVHDVLRAVCRNLLDNPKDSVAVQRERAQILHMAGMVFQQAKCDPDDRNVDNTFEILVAEATVKSKQAAEERRLKQQRKEERRRERREKNTFDHSVHVADMET